MRKDIIYDEERKAYTVYGIDAISSEGDILLTFSDVFFDRQKAERFVSMCNKGKLALIHLADAVEDALAE